jgi:hypothetical protein
VHRPRETIRLHDVFHAREENARVDLLDLALIRAVMAMVMIVVVATRRSGGTRADVARLRSPTSERAATVLLTHPLANAQSMHKLRPSAKGGLLALLLLLLCREMLCLPVCLLKCATKQVGKSTWLKSKEYSPRESSLRSLQLQRYLK